MAAVSSRVLMLGPALGTAGAIPAVVDAYHAHALFRRWPVEYLAASAPLRALRALLGTLGAGQRAVVHLHVEATPGFWRQAAFMGVAAAARCPVVLQLHGAGFLRDSDGIAAHAALRLMLERAAYVVVPCEAVAIWARGLVRGAQVVTVLNPVQPAERPATAERPNLVLYLAPLEASQGIFDLLEALAAVRAAVPDVRLVCAGEGDRAAVTRFAERLGIGGMVKLTGWAGPSARRALLESAAVFALPAYEEALPMGLVDAMAAGVPVVVSPVGGVPEAVVDGVSGFFAAPGDIATLTRLLRKLLLDRAAAARVGAAARESARLRFAPERAVTRLGELYASLGVRAWNETPTPLAAA